MDTKNSDKANSGRAGSKHKGFETTSMNRFKTVWMELDEVLSNPKDSDGKTGGSQDISRHKPLEALQRSWLHPGGGSLGDPGHGLHICGRLWPECNAPYSHLEATGGYFVLFFYVWFVFRWSSGFLDSVGPLVLWSFGQQQQPHNKTTPPHLYHHPPPAAAAAATTTSNNNNNNNTNIDMQSLPTSALGGRCCALPPTSLQVCGKRHGSYSEDEKRMKKSESKSAPKCKLRWMLDGDAAIDAIYGCPQAWGVPKTNDCF